MTVLVLVERPNSIAELCSGARQLGEPVEAIIVGSDNGQGYADRVWNIPVQEDVLFEEYTDTIERLIRKIQPNILLVEPTKRCKVVAGRLAARLGTSIITDVTDISKDGETIRMVYGGAAVQKEKAVDSTTIATVSAGVFQTAEPVAMNVEVETLQFIQPDNKIKVLKREQKPKASTDLTKAKRIIGVGRGIVAKEDLEMIRELAELIGAEVGCTRPIVEGEGWMAKETYIGVSGIILSPDVYISLGISGQVQHTVGIDRSKVVIAINKDKNALIFNHADYGIVADLYKVVPALVEHFKAVPV